jgi:thymidine kinase
VKYANDDRYSESDIVSHDHQSLPAVSARQIVDFKHKTIEYDVVGIDEGQFVSSSMDSYFKFKI